MRLLKKSVIDAQVARERKAQIDEGVMLAQKIDALRQTLGSLQKQHADFLAGLKGDLTRETQDLIEKIASLKEELVSLEEDRIQKRVSLDAEWADVNKKSKEVSELKISVKDQLSKLSHTKKTLDERNKRAKETVFKARTNERQIKKLLERTKLLYEHAVKFNEESQQKHDLKEKELSVKEEGLTNKEQGILQQEISHQNYAELLENRKLELDKLEIRLRDQRETLERALKRLN